jgi:hypothetical protein
VLIVAVAAWAAGEVIVPADRVFTGDTPPICGAGRTDFRNGDPRPQYGSIFNS